MDPSYRLHRRADSRAGPRLGGELEEALNRCRGVVFDFDGTLFDLDVDWRGLRLALDRRFPGVGLDKVGIRLSLDVIERDYGPDALRAALDMVSRFEAAGSARPRLPVVALARELKGNGKRLGLFSANSRSTLAKALQDFGLVSAFDAIVGAEDPPRRKPHPEGLLLAIASLGLEPKDAVYIADGPDEPATAKLACVTQYFNADCIN